MSRSAQHCPWHLLTSALDTDVYAAIIAFVSCWNLLSPKCPPCARQATTQGECSSMSSSVDPVSYTCTQGKLMSEQTNPGRRNTPSQAHSAQVRWLLVVWLKGHEEVGVTERVRVGALLELVLAVDVRHHLLVVVVETRYDHLVEVDDDDVAVAVDVAHHAVVE